jgi:uncharacterized protein YdiU (UPF0061 family)
MDAYDPGTVFSSIDANGRYAYGNQPRIGLWNLTRFAETLLPLLDEDETAAIVEAEAALNEFAPQFQAAYDAGLRQKLGLFTTHEDDGALIRSILDAMTANKVDFTLFFRRLARAQSEAGDEVIRPLFADPAAYDDWIVRWRARLALEPQDAAAREEMMDGVNPAFIPRNHRVEAVIKAAVEREDFRPFEELLAVLSRPFEDKPVFGDYANPPAEEERVLRTFCGT